jgi:hypothetical protein
VLNIPTHHQQVVHDAAAERRWGRLVAGTGTGLSAMSQPLTLASWSELSIDNLIAPSNRSCFSIPASMRGWLDRLSQSARLWAFEGLSAGACDEAHVLQHKAPQQSD